jgi:hypothetical protein
MFAMCEMASRLSCPCASPYMALTPAAAVPALPCSLSLLVSGVFFALFPLMATASVAAGFAALVLTVGGAAAANGPGVTIVAHLSKGPTQVVCMPLYNSVSTVGGFVGPYLAGEVHGCCAFAV